MEPLFVIAGIIAIIGGICDGFKKMENTRKGIYPGVKPSKSLFTFLFLD